MGYIRGFIHGAAVGTVVGLCVAPQTGDRTRAQLQQAAQGIREAVDVISRAVSQVAPVASSAVQAVERVRHRGDQHDINGSTVRVNTELRT